MFANLGENMKEWLGSKKTKGFLVGLVILILLGTGVLVVEKEIKVLMIKVAMVLVLGYLGAQGLADFGKEKALMEAVMKADDEPLPDEAKKE